MVVRARRFVYRPGIEAELRVSPEVGQSLGGVADDAASAARAVAPVRTGAYRSSIASSVERGASGVIAKVAATVPYAPFVEYGTSDTPAFAPIRRGMAAAGKGI